MLSALVCGHAYESLCLTHGTTYKGCPKGWESRCTYGSDTCRHCGTKRMWEGLAQFWEGPDGVRAKRSPKCILRARTGGPIVDPSQPTPHVSSADREGHVYFIAAGSHVKIGWAVEPTKRLADLATANPITLELLHTTPGTRRLERALHATFARQRVRGEWFRRTPALDAYIAEARAA